MQLIQGLTAEFTTGPAWGSSPIDATDSLARVEFEEGLDVLSMVEAAEEDSMDEPCALCRMAGEALLKHNVHPNNPNRGAGEPSVAVPKTLQRSAQS